MSIKNGKALEFEIITTKGHMAKAIVTCKLDHRERAYVRPNGDVVWADDAQDIRNSPAMLNDMLTIVEHIRGLNGYAA